MQHNRNKTPSSPDVGADQTPDSEYAGFLVSELKLGEGLIIDEKSLVIIHKTHENGATVAVRAPKDVKIKRIQGTKSPRGG